MKWRDQPPHHAIKVLKLPLPIRHLSHHGSQRCPLDHKRSIQHLPRDTGAPGNTRLPWQRWLQTLILHLEPQSELRHSSQTAAGTETPGACPPGTSPCTCTGRRSPMTCDRTLESCGETHSMILSSGMKGLRESRPSLLITCGEKITLLPFNTRSALNNHCEWI